jgi:LysM repeat protein
MTERGQPSLDGSAACPFVAFDDDRDSRADRPDHRHRCFAEADPAPRALAHQEAYCLSSAFPVCPTFQAWARREAAQAKVVRGPADASAASSGATTTTDVPASGATAAASGDGADERDGSEGGADGAAEWSGGRPDDDIPLEARPRRNPPRDWAAPPPWATGAGSAGVVGAAGVAGASGSAASRPPGSEPDRAGDAPGFLAPRSAEGQGLAGSSADRLASGESIEDVMSPGAPNGPEVAPPAVPQGSSTRSGDLPSSAPDPELAGLVGGAAAARSVSSSSVRGTASPGEATGDSAYPPSTRSGRRPSVSSTRTPPKTRDQTTHLEHVQHDGPSWEHARRYEAYPTIKTRAGFAGMPALPRIAVLAGALGIAALALFFLPALLGIGGGGGGASPSPSSSAQVSASPSPTAVPEPTPQVYVIKEGDTLSKIAKRNDITLDQLLAANKDTIKDPDRISVGDEIIIPVPVPDEVSGGSVESIAP